MSNTLKIVVIGGTGLIGAKLVAKLRQQGHEVVAASRSTGINAVTGEGLSEALNGAQVVVDVSNSPSFEDQAVMEFFEASTHNLLEAEASAGVGHHIALSVVGTNRLQDSGYFRAKLVQEKLIEASPIPYTILRATQFFEFLGAIAQFSTVGDEVHLPATLFQPLAAEDVALALLDLVNAEPANGILEVAGPEPRPLDGLVREYLSTQGDSRAVVTDENAGYFGLKITDKSLTPGENPILGTIRFEDWVRQSEDG